MENWRIVVERWRMIIPAWIIIEGEVVDPGTSARSRHNVLACRSCAPAAEQPRINGMALWPVGNLLWPTLGAFAYSIE